MSDVVIENPILNSPFEEPRRHFRFGDEGITNDIVASRAGWPCFSNPRQPAVFGVPLLDERGTQHSAAAPPSTRGRQAVPGAPRRPPTASARTRSFMAKHAPQLATHRLGRRQAGWLCFVRFA
jgi:hypothetical protein